jgi:hypothetical protein
MLEDSTDYRRWLDQDRSPHSKALMSRKIARLISIVSYSKIIMDVDTARTFSKEERSRDQKELSLPSPMLQ